MKNFFAEFKKFITRGNVVDLAVGVIIGGAFTGIVNGLSNYVLKPIINWLLALVLGKDGLSGAVTILSEVKDAEGMIDLSKSIYIDWGAFISAIINFFIVAIVLFLVIKTINRIQEGNTLLQNNLKKYKLTKQDRMILKSRGVKVFTKQIAEDYYKEKLAIEEEIKAKEKAEAEAKAKKEREENPTVEDLLKDIKALLEKSSK